MKLSELKRDFYKEFCEEHGFLYGVKGDFALIEQDECCTEQEYFRLKALMCIGYCDVSHESFSDIPVPKHSSEIDLEAQRLDHIIALKRIEVVEKGTAKEEAKKWVLAKLEQKRVELFGLFDEQISREDVFQLAAQLYQEKHGHTPSKLHLVSAVDAMLPQFLDPEQRVDLLGSIAEKRALHIQAGSQSPLSQETIDLIDAVHAALCTLSSRHLSKE